MLALYFKKMILWKRRIDILHNSKLKKCGDGKYRQGDELNNGSTFLERLSVSLKEATKDMIYNCGFDFEEESAFYATRGIQKSNTYLYVRGHCLYNSLISIGTKLCEGIGVDFEQYILKSALAFGQYNEILKIKADVGKLNAL